MGIEKIVGVVGLSLATAFSQMYGCGEECTEEECTEEVVHAESVGGLYKGTYKVTDDPQDKVLPENEEGELDVPVIPLDSENRYVQVGLFEWRDYERSDDGWIEDAWTDLWGDTYHVRGTISDNGMLDLDASVDGFDYWENEDYFINWKLDCEKQTEYVPEE